ncbi:hypothetical protein RB653_003113 [Dictyostelium firmibasis]|uniref:Fatty acid hydroxylase domain-containing protein n=1 Tax=Dictyostelium firmibasis TaxID=79012 RepID=A0AAN7U3Z0_9MYCE
MVEFTLLDDDVYFHDYIADFIPLFILSILLEFVINVFFKKKKNYYSLSDSLSSMGTGISTVVLERIVPYTILSSIEFVGAVYIYKHYRFFDVFESSIIAWIICLLAVDFVYYWFHRFAHEINFMWATHVTHHSSDKYNLTTALRQSIFQMYFSWILFLPIGFFIPPGIYVFHKQFNTINQFWIHTQLIGKLPWPIEFIMNTPSHHRVHHGRNPKYLDKNYAGTLIIWDRIFGTFQEEDIENERVYYGLVHQFESNDPTWSQIHHWFDIYDKQKQYSSIKEKLKSIFYGPGWKKGDTNRIGDLSTIPIPTEKDEKERIKPSLSTSLNIYLFIHYFLSSFLALSLRSLFEDKIGSANVTCSFIFVYMGLTSFGAIFDRKWYAILLEHSRLWSFIIYTLYLESNSSIISQNFQIISLIRYIYFFSSMFLIIKKLSPWSILSNYLKSSKKLLNKLD